MSNRIDIEGQIQSENCQRSRSLNGIILAKLHLIDSFFNNLDSFHMKVIYYLQRNRHFLCGIGYFPLKVKLIGYLSKHHMGVTELFSYIFYVTLTILIGYSIIMLLIDTPCLKNNWVFQKNN